LTQGWRYRAARNKLLDSADSWSRCKSYDSVFDVFMNFKSEKTTENRSDMREFLRKKQDLESGEIFLRN